MMKKKLYSTFAMMSLFIALAITSVQAESLGKLDINIPFEFNVGSKTLPAGEYSVKRLTQTSMLVISADGKQSAIALTIGSTQQGANEKRAAEKLVFRQYGNQYFLSQVWMARDGEGRSLSKSDAERKAASTIKLVANDSEPLTVVVAAKRAR
jgi:hypothetical protein